MKLSMNHLFGKDEFPFDVLINTCKFSFQSLGAQTLEELKLQDVPIVQGYTIYMDEKSWAENPQGVTPLDVNLSISQPELDGVIQGGVVACQTYDERGHYVYLPVKERIAAIVQRAIKWSTLLISLYRSEKWPLYYITIRLRTPTLALPQVLIHLSRCYGYCEI